MANGQAFYCSTVRDFLAVQATKSGVFPACSGVDTHAFAICTLPGGVAELDCGAASKVQIQANLLHIGGNITSRDDDLLGLLRGNRSLKATGAVARLIQGSKDRDLAGGSMDIRLKLSSMTSREMWYSDVDVYQCIRLLFGFDPIAKAHIRGAGGHSQPDMMPTSQMNPTWISRQCERDALTPFGKLHCRRDLKK